MTAPATDARFLACLEVTLKWEGGYSNDKYDPGGATMKGIIQREYDSYRVRHGLPKQSVRNISDDEVDDIYFNSYWDEVRADELPAGVDLAVFDFGVNSGPTTAIKYLQKALGVNVDGHIGQITLNAVHRADPDATVSAIMSYRRAYLRSLKTFWRFGNGWLSRCAGIERQGLEWGGTDVAHIPSIAPHEDATIQSASQGRAWDNAPEKTLDTAGGKASAALAGLGKGQMAVSFMQAAQTSYTPGHGIDLVQLMFAIGTNPLFWSGAGTVLCAAIYWLERRGILKFHLA